MAEKPNSRGLVGLLVAKVVCCGALLLAVTGALSVGGIAAWFAEGGIVWVAVAALVAAALYLGWRRPQRRAPADAILDPDDRAQSPGMIDETPPALGNGTALETAYLKIGGMTCERCAHVAQTSLERIPGILRSRVSLAEGIATVTYDPNRVGVGQMLEPVQQRGFVPSVLAASEASGNAENSAMIVPSGFARTSWRVDGLYEPSDLVKVRHAVEALPGVSEAGAHRRSNDEPAAVVWVTYDPRRLTAETVLETLRAIGFRVIEAEASVP